MKISKEDVRKYQLHAWAMRAGAFELIAGLILAIICPPSARSWFLGAMVVTMIVTALLASIWTIEPESDWGLSIWKKNLGMRIKDFPLEIKIAQNQTGIAY